MTHNNKYGGEIYKATEKKRNSALIITDNW